MADLRYLYSPYYGIEPFDPVTSGAKLTGQNLVISAWPVLGQHDFPPYVTVGPVLQPASQNENLPPARRAADAQAFNSRHSAQLFVLNGPGEGPYLAGPLLFALNPPPELKQQWAKAVEFNGGDPADIANYTVNKSLMCGYTWNCLWETPSEDQNNIDTIADCGYKFGTSLALGPYVPGASQPFPLLKTSGADGVAPVFFDGNTAVGIAEMLAAVDKGDFFVPLLITGGITPSARITIVYPHSTARG